MKNITILGSTGSIGVQALQVINNIEEEFNLVGISANKNVDLLIKQAKLYKPKYVCISDNNYKDVLVNALNSSEFKILSGRDGLLELSQNNDEYDNDEWNSLLKKRISWLDLYKDSFKFELSNGI